MSRLPDFIVIGAMKCATSTLHAQLARQPGFFMSTPKEPNFFSDDAVYARGLDWYAGLFAAAPAGALCGESSTHYTKLPTHPLTVRRLREHLPAHVKFVYVMRDPIARLISQYQHEWTERRAGDDLDAALRDVPGLVAYGRYAMQLEPYLETFGPERVLPVFFERLGASPQSELERVARFVGHAGPVRWDEALGAQNVSRERERRSRLRNLLVDNAVSEALRRALLPKAARNAIRRLWQPPAPPELSPVQREKLAGIFDADLERLSRWLGVRLDCASFARVARETAAEWRGDPPRPRTG